MTEARGFDAFYQESRSRTLTYLFAVCGDLAEAQDAAQEAYARAWQHWGGLTTAVANPEAWVRTVGWRVLAHRWRRLSSAARAYRRYGQPQDMPPPSEDTVALVAALRRLPEPQRQAIVLHHLLDISIGEIAAETGTAEGTIKARLSRGRAALAEILTVRQREEEHA